MVDKAQAESLLQVGQEKPDMEEALIKLQPVLQKLKSLDPKTFGLLNGMVDKAQAESFLQTPTLDEQDKLARLGPILDKLKHLDPKTFSMLNKMVGGSALLQGDKPFKATL